LQESPIVELITTDSVPALAEETPGITTLSVAELLAEAILRIHNNQSISSLFRV
jgi:ribose-phosphate pyrophosphokinase